MNKLVAVVGGDHSAPFGAIRAIAEAHPGLGILHIDAHADLREAYEGFTWSHASIMHNVVTHLHAHLARATFDGVPWSKTTRRIVNDLPRQVYVSFDIDGLDPALCPH